MFSNDMPFHIVNNKGLPVAIGKIVNTISTDYVVASTANFGVATLPTAKMWVVYNVAHIRVTDYNAAISSVADSVVSTPVVNQPKRRGRPPKAMTLQTAAAVMSNKMMVSSSGGPSATVPQVAPPIEANLDSIESSTIEDPTVGIVAMDVPESEDSEVAYPSATLNELIGVSRLTADLRFVARNLSDNEARLIVNLYYMLQKDRIRANNQVKALSDSGNPSAVISFFASNFELLEDQLRLALDTYSKHHPWAQWSRSVIGIGPVVAAGLLAHLDFRKAKTAGSIWRYCGIDPTSKWLGREKATDLVIDVIGKSKVVTVDHLAEIGQKNAMRNFVSYRVLDPTTGEMVMPTRAQLIKRLSVRPWNAEMKRLCFIMGESFVKQRNRPKDVYGKLYIQKKEQLIAKNLEGGFAERSKEILSKKNFGHDTDAYKAYSIGQLPPAHIHAMARRYAVQIFLSHLFDTVYPLANNGEAPPKPYVFEHLGHTHMIPVPDFPEKDWNNWRKEGID